MADESFFHVHAHSHYSVLDGMPSVTDMVKRAKKHRQPGLGLTDHGVMSGVAELYRVCREEGITPFPGQEFYVVRDVDDKTAPRWRSNTTTKTTITCGSINWLYWPSALVPH